MEKTVGDVGAHIQILAREIIVIGGREVIDQLQILHRKLHARCRETGRWRHRKSRRRSARTPCRLADSHARASPDAGAAVGRLEELRDVIRRAEIHGIHARLRAVAALRRVGVQNVVHQVQAPVLGKRRHELLRRRAVLAVDGIQRVQLAVARDNEHGGLQPVFADQRRVIQRVGTQPERLLVRLAFRLERLFPNQFAGVGIEGEEIVGGAAHDHDLRHTLVGGHPLDVDRRGQRIQFARLVIEVRFPQQRDGFRVIAVDFGFLAAPTVRCGSWP